jgi:hypothetical protein
MFAVSINAPITTGSLTAQVLTSEALAAGDLVNTWNNAGVLNARKADASVFGKQADGFVLSAFAISTEALVYFPGGDNTAVTGMTPGRQFLSDTTPGKTQTTVPSTAGHLVQTVGIATSATNLIFDPQTSYYL